MIQFSPPRIDERVIKEVTNALLSGWITTGPRTKLFEKNISAYCGHESTLCLNSASAGLELVLRWFGVKEGDEVIIPAYTYAATANVVIHCGAKPIFVDVNHDFCINIQKIREAITAKTKVIMPVDIGGFPCDYDELNSLVRQPEISSLFCPSSPEQKMMGRILILSDAAHSIGARYKGKLTGTLTDITVFSFHAVKNLTTAEGGAICLNLEKPFDNAEIYRNLNIKSLHGQNKDALAKTQLGNWQYDIVEAGYKCNMTDIQAAIGLVELERYDEDMLPRRKAIFDHYSNALSTYSWARIPEYANKDKTSSFHLYLLRVNNINEIQRNEIIRQIFAKEVSVNVHYIPLPMLTYYRGLGYEISDYPQTYANYACEISLPVYYNLTDEQLDCVIDAVVTSVENVISN